MRETVEYRIWFDDVTGYHRYEVQKLLNGEWYFVGCERTRFSAEKLMKKFQEGTNERSTTRPTTEA